MICARIYTVCAGVCADLLAEACAAEARAARHESHRVRVAEPIKSIAASLPGSVRRDPPGAVHSADDDVNKRAIRNGNHGPIDANNGPKAADAENLARCFQSATGRSSGALIRISGALIRISGALIRISGALIRISGALIRINGALIRISRTGSLPGFQSATGRSSGRT
jgi:hypothetical protein